MKKNMSYRQLNFAITLILALFGMSTPQNKIYSEHSNDPIPDDIRANKKEGDAYDTIGDVLVKGGWRKVAVIATMVLILVMAVVRLIMMITNGVASCVVMD